MIVEIIAVHPSVTVVSGGGRQFEVPTEAFASPPQIGQQWDLTLVHMPSPADQAEKLNDYLTNA